MMRNFPSILYVEDNQAEFKVRTLFNEEIEVNVISREHRDGCLSHWYDSVNKKLIVFVDSAIEEREDFVDNALKDVQQGYAMYLYTKFFHEANSVELKESVWSYYKFENSSLEETNHLSYEHSSWRAFFQEALGSTFTGCILLDLFKNGQETRPIKMYQHFFKNQCLNLIKRHSEYDYNLKTTVVGSNLPNKIRVTDFWQYLILNTDRLDHELILSALCQAVIRLIERLYFEIEKFKSWLLDNLLRQAGLLPIPCCLQ